jgi:hypothetical protein
VKHGEELAGRQQHVVTKPAGNDAVVHHGLVGLVLEVGVPAALEVRSRPVLELLELFLSRADLDAGFDAVGGEWTGSFQCPLIENLCSGLAPES